MANQNTSLLSRMINFWRNGVSFGGNRDLYAVFGWNRVPQYKDFLEMYRRNGVAKRIINAPANALWSDPPDVEADTEFQAAWTELLRTQKVFFNLNRVDKLAGLGQYAVLVIGFDDGQPLNMPVRAQKGRKVIYLQPYSQVSATVSQYESNPASPRFGLPTLYQVNMGSDPMPGVAQKTQLNTTIMVHWTRVLHVAEGALETLVYGRPRIESCFNALCDLQKITGGAAETYWLAGNRGLHVDVDKEMEMDSEDEDALEEELKEYQHELRRTIRTRGVKVTEIASKVADPRPAFQTVLDEIAADTGIPQRMLTGSEAGQLASQQDRASWAQRVSERISDFGEPIVLLPFVRVLIDAGVLPPPKQFIINWPDAFKMNPLERAQTSAQMARSATNLAGALSKIEDLNQSMARAAMPQLVNSPMTSTSSSDSVPTDPNATPTANAKGKKDTTPTTTDPSASGGDSFGQPQQPQVVTQPLMPKRPPIVLLTEEECRSIIGFGKHPPVFDSASEQTSAVAS